MNGKDGVSIVICCYNSSARITPTLEHLQKIKTDKPWEIILVDNCSDDDTAAKALNIWEKNPVTSLSVVTENIPGLMHARQKGVETAIYNVISFIDDDNWIESLWVDKVFSIMKNNSAIAACGGRSEGVLEIPAPAWFNDFSKSYAVGKQQNESGYVKAEKGYLWGAGLTVRRNAWDELFNSGFSSLLKGRNGKSLTAGEDSELCFAWLLLGWKLWYDDSLSLMHFIPASRLKIDYLERMITGFGKAEVVLSLYRSNISGNKMNKSSWLLQCLASVKNLCKSGLKSIFSSGKNKIRDKLNRKHNRAYTFELILNRKKYYITGLQVKKLIGLKENKN